ncbi:MAG: RagB/SusD family nutrient uptake outer membrane protein [Dysgonamonadaceae bacterium]|nr:RagB/SusD family nutrient uptake outer membrane protein [Dysgonamonadaceae bacterium]
MKLILKSLCCASILFVLNACNTDFLNLTDPDTFDVPKYYQTEQDMEDALTAAYSATRIFYNQLYYVTEMKSDNTGTTNTGDSGGLYATFTTHLVNANNTVVTNVYNGLYITIYRANLVLKYIDKVKMSDESRARITAEAKFLRALSHFYLVRLWGPVTMVDKIIETTDEAKAVTRQTVDEVYRLIVDDLKEVASCTALATFEGGDRMGHATRTAGAALLGKVYVTMAATLGNASYYNDAVTCLQQACTLTDMQALPTAFTGIFGTANEACTELIFQCMYIANATEYSTFAYDFQPYSQLGMTSQLKGRGCNLGEKNLFDEFETGDRRKAVCITATTDGNSYYTKKYVDLSNTSGLGGNNWIELRFADVFLLLAEAYERLNDPDNAIKYLDLVRTKHGALKGYEASLTDYPDYAVKYPTLRDAIFHERRMELCFENHRWFDLQRLYPHSRDLAAFMQSVATTLKYSGFRAYEALLPIPYDEVFFNAKIYQNEVF